MLTPEQVQFFHDNGYLLLDGLVSGEDCDRLLEAARGLVRDFDPSTHPRTVFSTVKQTQDDYFINSGDNISYFFEEGAVDENGALTVPKEQSLNKIGHALHELEPTFRELTHRAMFREILNDLGLKDPVIPQSMVIFKQPRIGGKVTSHQDSTFLYTDPQTTTGIWIPLEDCTVENGCLWMLPGSHKDGLARRMIRKEGGGVEFTAPPAEYDDSKFIPAPCKRGTVVVIHGAVVHKSSENTSDKSRNVYTFHSISGSAHYCNKNWCVFPLP
eukprot:comp17061_c0_seq2/m.15799 comp17061_c0_seq2/g.15799  ORF comp17061_c0_seq2/g.15799 comp17061_c0_seq2/m.15799 type:complete len:271 (-) comp17061_c0_seq2:20-832(-)